jgi:hypothetical protein
MTNKTSGSGAVELSLARCRDVTRDLPSFLGLRLLPVGVWFLVAPALGRFEASRAHYGLAIAAAVAIVWIDRLYRRRFGTVVTDRVRLGRARGLVAGAAVAYLALFAASSLPGTEALVGALVAIVFGTAAVVVRPLAFGAPRRRLEAVALGVAFGGAAAVAAAGSPLAHRGAGVLLCLAMGVLLCLAGVAEHLALRAALPATEACDA